MGCYGGIGGSMRTTSLLVDDDVLVDAGTGVTDLSLDALVKIDHIFITHSHLDHIAFIPLLLDTVMGLRNMPVIVHANAQVINILKLHVFNWLIWPDFNMIPDAKSPFLIYNELNDGDSVTINKKTFTSLPANHVVPANGYQISGSKATLVFTGDTAGGEVFWDTVNKIKDLKYLVIETAFSNAEADLASISKHLCPKSLATELAHLKSNPEIFITHLKPSEDKTIIQEIASNPITQHCKALHQNQLFDL